MALRGHEDELTLSFLQAIGIPSLRMPQEDPVTTKNVEDIASLKHEILQKDEEIAQLRKSVQHLQDQNNDLDISLKARSEEVRSLKRRIQTLENEKKDLQEELASVNYKLDHLQKDVKELANAKEKQDEENQKLDENLLKVSSKLDSVREDLEKTKGENEKLKREMKDFRDSAQLRAVVGPSRVPLHQALTGIQTETMALVYLGQLCQEIQALMYLSVLPEFYTPLRSYKVKAIEKDINKLPKTEEETQKAKQKWSELKSKLNWSENYVEAMKSLQNSRNQEAHPKLNEESLLRVAEDMNDKGKLKGWLSLQCVKDLIQIWKTLECIKTSSLPL